MESRFLTVKEIKVLEGCGRDKAYEIARSLPHEIRGRDIYVFKESYEEFYEQRKTNAYKNQNVKVFKINRL